MAYKTGVRHKPFICAVFIVSNKHDEIKSCNKSLSKPNRYKDENTPPDIFQSFN